MPVSLPTGENVRTTWALRHARGDTVADRVGLGGLGEERLEMVLDHRSRVKEREDVK